MAQITTTETLDGIGADWVRDRLAGLPADAGRGETRVAAIESLELPRGTMPPLYVRDRDETVQVLRGEVTFYVGREVVRARAGDAVVLPRDVPRTFRVESERARWLVVTEVRSLVRYEDFGRAVASAEPSRVPQAWDSEDDAATVGAIAAANGIVVLGPPGTLPHS
jgi:quercetin dioxygenase-like cupin family protein